MRVECYLNRGIIVWGLDFVIFLYGRGKVVRGGFDFYKEISLILGLNIFCYIFM